jgi:hypothetical protein
MLSGFVTTRDGTYPAFISAESTLSARAPVPKNAYVGKVLFIDVNIV